MALFKNRRRSELPDLSAYPMADRITLSALLAHGADLSAPRHVLHYLYVDSRERQAEAGALIASSGWEVTEPEPLPDYPAQWLVRAEREGAVLTPELVSGSRRLFEDLADRFEGEYDGWEASV